MRVCRCVCFVWVRCDFGLFELCLVLTLVFDVASILMLVVDCLVLACDEALSRVV